MQFLLVPKSPCPGSSIYYAVAFYEPNGPALLRAALAEGYAHVRLDLRQRPPLLLRLLLARFVQLCLRLAQRRAEVAHLAQDLVRCGGGGLLAVQLAPATGKGVGDL